MSQCKYFRVHMVGLAQIFRHPEWVVRYAVFMGWLCGVCARP